MAKLSGPIGYYVDGTLYPPGSVIYVQDDAEVERLIRLGFRPVEAAPRTAHPRSRTRKLHDDEQGDDGDG